MNKYSLIKDATKIMKNTISYKVVEYMGNIGIIHLSDIHFCSENQEVICEQLQKLLIDIKMISEKEKISIDAICLTGDLINAGANNEKEFDLFYKKFILPLLENTKLELENIFFVPGNHEIDTSKIDEFTEEGACTKLVDSNSIDDFFRKPSLTVLDRIAYFKDIYNKYCKAQLVYEDEFCRCYKKEIHGVSFGFACLNSAWRSSGKGYIERGKMIIGSSQVRKALDAISDMQIKVCLVHHPLDWLVECDQFDVEKCIYNFDLILNGHIHTLDSKRIVAYHGESVISTCGKFFPTQDIYNGYSIISINPETLEGDIYLRQYYAGARNCFDENLQLYKNGTFGFRIGNRNSLQKKAFEVLRDIQTEFMHHASSFFVSNFAGNKLVQSFEDAFVIPLLGRFSEYEKESNLELNDLKNYNASDSYLSLENIICDQHKNIVILGKKEYGKTTLLHYIMCRYFKQYMEFNKIPVLIDCAEDFSGKSVIEKKCVHFFAEFGSGLLSISVKEIQEMAHEGRFVFLFDNLDIKSQKKLEKIKKFAIDFPKNRFIFSTMELIDTEDITDAINFLDLHIMRVYIHSMKEQQVRALASSMFSGAFTVNENIIDKTLLCFRNTNLPKTPFVVSLVLSLCSEDTDLVPLNESTVMQNFLDALLDKNSKESARISAYDHVIKEDFLCYLVEKMYRTGVYAFSQQEFEELLAQYHQSKGFTIKESKFDQLFFDKGILYFHAGVITFRYSCMAHYYLAKLALKSPDIFNQIFTGDNYLDYYYEINYLTGLARDRHDIYEKLSKDFEDVLKQCQPILCILDSYGIKTNFSISPQKLEHSVIEQIAPRKEDNIVKHYPDLQVVDSSYIKKESRDMKEDPKKRLIAILLVYATVLKNSELYSIEIKEKMMRRVVDGFCIALAVLAKTIDENWPSIMQQIQKESGDQPADEIDQQLTQDEGRLLEDIIKISLPLIIENVAFENVGSAKLKAILSNMIRDEKYVNTFQGCMTVFLYCDLRIPGCLKEMEKFAKQTSSKDLLTIVLFKAVYYHQTRYFPEKDDNMLANIIADINLKLHNMGKLAKSYLIKQIEENRPNRTRISPV